MKVVIEAVGIKRQLDGPFGICASRRDMETIRDQINNWLSHEPEYSYGWLTIWPGYKSASPPNTAPIPWTDGAGPGSEAKAQHAQEIRETQEYYCRR